MWSVLTGKVVVENCVLNDTETCVTVWLNVKNSVVATVRVRSIVSVMSRVAVRSSVRVRSIMEVLSMV
jgi:hypothetical protein